MDHIESHIDGIPCRIEVLTCTVVEGSYSSNAPSDLDFYGYREIEFQVLDRRGYKAPWLERKMSKSDINRIEHEILDQRKKAAYEDF